MNKPTKPPAIWNDGSAELLFTATTLDAAILVAAMPEAKRPTMDDDNQPWPIESHPYHFA